MEIYSWGRKTGPKSFPRWKKELIAVSLAFPAVGLDSPQGSRRTSYWGLQTLQHWGPDRSRPAPCLCSLWPAPRNPWGRTTPGGAPQSPISPVTKVSLKRKHNFSHRESTRVWRSWRQDSWTLNSTWHAKPGIISNVNATSNEMLGLDWIWPSSPSQDWKQLGLLHPSLPTISTELVPDLKL